MPEPDLATLSGALGSVIGYLGAEVAEASLFARLLWPKRYYNEASILQMIRMAIVLPMGGPLHKAALETLGKFRGKGLYGGIRRGHMLGTAFFEDQETKYVVQDSTGKEREADARNGLWITVMRRTSRLDVHAHEKVLEKQADAESGIGEPAKIRRTVLLVQRLTISRLHEAPATLHIFTENGKPLQSYTAIIGSELTAIAMACVVIAVWRSYWFGAYYFIPIVLKLLAIPLSLRREQDLPLAPAHSGPRDAKNEGETQTELFCISDYDHGFSMIEGPDELVRPFFRHWGHPIRTHSSDRVRELASIGLVLAFVLYFPAGLLAVLWVRSEVQISWLAYQMFLVVVMHLMRLFGSDDDGRLEDGIARRLVAGEKVVFRSGNRVDLLVGLESTHVGSVAEGREEVRRIVASHREGVKGKR